jgi:aquaporin Z
MLRPLRAFAAELLGTGFLVLFGVGAMVLADDLDLTSQPIGRLGVAVVFGVVVATLTYAIGTVSGAHVNPAVTVAFWLARRTPTRALPFYLVGQFVGGFLGALVVWVVAKGHAGFDATGNFAQLGWGSRSPEGYAFGAVAVAEVVVVTLVVFATLATRHERFPGAATGLAAGFAYLVGLVLLLPVDNGGANPARAVATAIFAGTDAARQVWLFVLAPLGGSVLGVLAWLAIDDARLEDTRLATRATLAVRDAGDEALERAADAIDGDDDGDDAGAPHA